MEINVDLFTKTYRADLTIDAGQVQLTLKAEDRENLEEYLLLVLPSYMDLPAGELTLEQLLQYANEWQLENPDLKLSEPFTKLPYDVEIEVKAMLEEIAKETGMSQSQLLQNIVNKAFYEKVKGRK